MKTLTLTALLRLRRQELCSLIVEMRRRSFPRVRPTVITPKQTFTGSAARLPEGTSRPDGYAHHRDDNRTPLPASGRGVLDPA